MRNGTSVIVYNDTKTNSFCYEKQIYILDSINGTEQMAKMSENDIIKANRAIHKQYHNLKL